MRLRNSLACVAFSRARCRAPIAPVAAVLLLASLPALAHEDDLLESLSHGDLPDHDPPSGHSLHFSHPLITESPSPDTKLRLDYFYRRLHAGEEKGREHTLRLEAEYAFHPAISVEVDVPYTFVDRAGESPRSRLDTVEVGLKLANFAFAEHGLLLGYGIEFGLPTGDDSRGIGSNHLFEVEPFLDLGYRWRDLEVVSFARFGIPTHQGGDEEVETELGYNLSFLYHVTPRVSGLIELDGETVLSGEEHGNTVVNLTPGIKVQPLPTRALDVGFGVSFPITGREEFEVRTVLSAFYHF